MESVMKTLIAALLASMVAASASAEDLTAMKVRVIYSMYAQNFCAANVKWIYSTTASLQLAQAEDSNWLSVNYGILQYVIKTTGEMSDVEKAKTCDDAMEYLRAEHALLSPERGES
jgi:hypothetical protein